MRAEREIVRAIHRETQEPAARVRLWKERTGKSSAAYYRRKEQVAHPDFSAECDHE